MDYSLVHGGTMKIGDLVHSEWGKLGVLLAERDKAWVVYWQNGVKSRMETCYLHSVKKCP